MPWNTECFGLFSKTNNFVCDAVNAEKLQTLWLCDKFAITKKHNPILSSRLVKVSSNIKMTDSQKLFYIKSIQIIPTLFFNLSNIINLHHFLPAIRYGPYHMNHFIAIIFINPVAQKVSAMNLPSDLTSSPTRQALIV